MGTRTGKFITTIAATGRGSDYYGKCDQCGKHMSEAYKMLTQYERVRENGELYLSDRSAGVFGHKECLEERFTAGVTLKEMARP